MLTEHNRAFKEWAVVCDAMKTGRQILLLRKGGISEEEGAFQVNDPEFFLFPTHEHQQASLLQPSYANRLQENLFTGFDPRVIEINAYAVVDTIVIAEEEARANAIADETVWNAKYVKQRFDFNPYDPLYIMILRVFNLPQSFTLPMRPDYIGCKSWVTLNRRLSTFGAAPAVPEDEFACRRAAVLAKLNS